MTRSTPTQTVTEYGQALLKALQSFAMLEPRATWFERLLIRLLRMTYRHRLRVMVVAYPTTKIRQK